MKRVAIAIFLFMVAFVIPVGIYYLVTSNLDIRNQASESTAATSTSSPQIVSVPVTSAEVGVEYEYKVRAVDADTTELTYIVKEKPSWLTWDETTKTFVGTPGESDNGTYSVQIAVSDGKWLSTQRYQIVVTGGTEQPASSEEQTEQPIETPVISKKSTTKEPDLSEYGLAPISETVSQASDETGTVLGTEDTQLPDTASFGGILLLSLGFAGLCVAIFLWLDAKHDLLHRITNWYGYARGKQISLKLDDGAILKKRRVNL